MSKFKVGDTVKIIRDRGGDDKLIGKICKIKCLRNTFQYPYALDIHCPNHDNVWGEDELELVTPKKEFKVGDKVRITQEGTTDNQSGLQVGETFIIHEISEQLDINWYRKEKGVPSGVQANCLELVEESKEVKSMEFKKGDKVRIVYASPSNHNGEEAIFRRMEDGEPVVLLDKKIEWYCKEIEPINKTNEVKGKMEEGNMKLDVMKKANLKEAKKQIIEERKNAEIESAKTQYNNAVNEIDALDRHIKQLEEQKSKQQEILDKFKAD